MIRFDVVEYAEGDYTPGSRYEMAAIALGKDVSMLKINNRNYFLVYNFESMERPHFDGTAMIEQEVKLTQEKPRDIIAVYSHDGRVFVPEEQIKNNEFSLDNILDNLSEIKQASNGWDI